MEIPVTGQALEAALSLYAGVMAGLVYDLLRTLRRAFRLRAVTMVSDALFWCVCALGMFALGLSAGGGEQRLFMLILAFLGGALYFLTVSPLVLEFGAFMTGILGRVLRFLTTPLRWMYRYLEKFRRFLKKAFPYLKKRFTIRGKRKKSTENADITEETAHAGKTHRYTY